MDVAEWLKGFLEDDLNDVTVKQATMTGRHLNMPVSSSHGIGSSLWSWGNFPRTEDRDPNFLELQEANNICKAAYQEFMRIAIEKNKNSSMVVAPPALGSVEDIQKLFQSPLSPETRVDVSTESAVLPISPRDLLSIMFQMNEWVPTFSHIVVNAIEEEPPDVLKRLSSTDAEIRNILMVTADFQLPTPFVRSHRFCFFRCLREIIPDIWAIVDVSAEYFGHNPDSLEKCRRRPSGLIVRSHGLHSEVIWVENMEWCDNHLKNSLYSDIVDSNMAFSAKRWVSTLQWWLKRRSSTIRFAKDIRLNHRANICLREFTDSMRLDYAGLVTDNLNERWISLCNSDVRIWRDAVWGNAYLAVTSFLVQAKPISVFELLVKKTKLKWLQWPALHTTEESELVLTSHAKDDQENCITVHRKQMMQSECDEVESEYLLQESSSDGFCSLVVSKFLTQQIVDDLLTSEVWSTDDGSLPSGFAILPDGANGSLVTIVVNQVLDTLVTDEANEIMENVIQSIVEQMRGEFEADAKLGKD